MALALVDWRACSRTHSAEFQRDRSERYPIVEKTLGMNSTDYLLDREG
jgi:hypothetical protein